MNARFRFSRAFTLIELLTVMAIIAILAGLVLGTAGYVQKKAARDRANTEIRAMEAALESYKADNGIYPSTWGGSRSKKPNDGGKSDVLYQALTGDGNDTLGGKTRSVGMAYGQQGKVYMELKESQLDSTKMQVQDPFGEPYNYVAPGVFNTASFDLWSGPVRPDINPGSSKNMTWDREQVSAKNW